MVAKILETLDEGEAIRLSNKESGRKKAEISVAKILPPVVSILSPKDGSETSAKEIEVKFEVRSPSGEPVTMGARAVAPDITGIVMSWPVRKTGQWSLPRPLENNILLKIRSGEMELLQRPW